MLLTLFFTECFAIQKSLPALVAPAKQFISPWNIPKIDTSDKCTRLCGDWRAPYLSGDVCVGFDSTLDDGEAAASTDILFCPDKAIIEPWTIGSELECESLFQYIQLLDKSELDVLKQMIAERKMKLSVNPWQMLPNEVYESQEKRRIQGSQSSYRCFGGNGGGRGAYERGVRPSTVRVRSGLLIDRLDFTYPNHGRLVGGGSGGGEHYHILPDCITIVLIKSGRFIDSIQFLSQGSESPRYGGNGGGTYVLVAPPGKCLGDIVMRAGRVVHKICLKFNA